MAECEGNICNSIITNEMSVDMATRQLQDLLTNAFSTLRSDIVTKFQVECSNLRADFFTITERLDSKLQAATAKIQQDNEKLTQNLRNEIQKLSNDICTLRNDTEHKLQEVTRTIGGLSDALNERMDAHVVATSKAHNSIEKVNTEITCLREQLAGRQLTESAIPNQALPVTAVNVESSSQSISGLATNAGSDHMGKSNVNNCTMSVCGNTKSQPNVNSNL